MAFDGRFAHKRLAVIVINTSGKIMSHKGIGKRYDEEMGLEW